jgi:hypothetical protein
VVTLEEESERATQMLCGKVVSHVVRHRDGEVVILFEGGTRLFVDAETSIELSITGQFDEGE